MISTFKKNDPSFAAVRFPDEIPVELEYQSWISVSNSVPIQQTKKMEIIIREKTYPAGDPSLQTAFFSFNKIFCVGGGSRELHLERAWPAWKNGRIEQEWNSLDREKSQLWLQNV